jgi:ribose transport system permease protein/erythritol transport system permease protein
MTDTSVTAGAPSPAAAPPGARFQPGRLVVAGVANRFVLLATLIVVLVVTMAVLSAAGLTAGPFNAAYLAAAGIQVVPMALLAMAQLVVIGSGAGGIDLSVGSTLTISGMVFGLAYANWGLPLAVAILAAVATGALCGSVNGLLVAWGGFPPLIATLATFYAYQSIALVMTGQKPISSQVIQDFYGAARAIDFGVAAIPAIPRGLITFLLPAAVVVWFLMNKTTWGRRIYAIGTNDVAARWTGIAVPKTRFSAYAASGLIAGLAAVYVVAQFASARPDAGTSGNGLALPSITIAVLGGVAITGGVGKVGGVLLSAVLVVWLNASILLLFPGNSGAQFQLLALGVVLIGSALLNRYMERRALRAKT